jgi:HAD superfamily hydrolase (TIGR01509 family)
MNDTAFVRAAFQRAGKDLTDEKMRNLIEGKTAVHRRMLEKALPLFPGVVTFVKAASRQFSLGVVSMARRVEIEETLNRAGLLKILDVIVSAEDVTTFKPDPACFVRGFLLVNESRRSKGESNITSSECLVIEDAPPGIRAASLAGMHSLGVTNTVAAGALRDAGADVVTNSLFDWTVDAVLKVFD